MSDLTLLEACEYLGKSKKTISRYISQGKLKAEAIKSLKGTLEYRFNKKALKALLASGDQTKRQSRRAKVPKQYGRPDREDKTGQRGQGRQDSDIVKLLKDTTQVLKDQLKTKDAQIKSLSGKIDGLIERGREANILIKGLQNRVLMLEAPADFRQDREDKTRHDRTEKTRQGKGIISFIRGLLNGKRKE